MGPWDRREYAMTPKTELATLADEILELESETFEISDYSDAAEVVLAGSTSCSSTSTCSSTTSTTSCSA
ncbi:thiazolylpeptide-type bacteriocin precursor [Streptomyces sp. CZ24]|nr:thiazolylpeptide-type bacteriocin precursor [Streptomyces sp. CZ24]